MVRSVFPEFSTMLLVSAESEAVIFSPAEKVPTTLCKTTVAPLVPSA